MAIYTTENEEDLPAGVPRAAVGARTARGATSALFRISWQLGVGLIASITLTRLLTPADYGLYAIIAGLTATPALLMAGMSAAIFAAPQRIKSAEFSSTFWIFFLAMSAAGIITAAATLAFVGNPTERFLLLALSIWIVLTPLRYPSEFHLLRDMRIGQIAIIEAFEIGIYQAVVVVCALLGLGARSFAIGLLAGVVVASISALKLYPWRPQRPTLQGIRGALPWLVRGLPFQAQTALNVAKDRLTLPVLALVASTSAVGWFGWAYTATGLVFILASLANQSLFVGLSYVKKEPDVLASATSMATRLLALLLIGLSAVLAGSIRPVITTVFSPRWLPATHSFWLLSISAITMAVALPLTQLARLDGRVKAVTRWQLANLAIIWGLGLPVAYLLNAGGLALAYALGSLVYAAWSYHSTRKQYQLDIIPAVARYAAAGIVAAGTAYALSRWLGSGITSVLVAPAGGGLVYLLLVLGLAHRQALRDLQAAWSLLRSRDPAPAPVAEAAEDPRVLSPSVAVTPESPQSTSVS
jgi:PST family polysaccharide transporter